MENMEEESKEQALKKPVLTADNQEKGRVNNSNNADILRLLENAPQKTVARYWHTEDEKKSIVQHSQNTLAHKKAVDSLYRKINNKQTPIKATNISDHSPKMDMSFFKVPKLNNSETTHDKADNIAIVELESSDEDEVVEIALPPKPTIMIDSSDDEESKLQRNSPPKNNFDSNSKPSSPREVLSSPVPSIVSSVSDEFIRGDCIALNISSKNPSKQSFDFSLHGSEFSGQSTPTKKKKKKKSKDNIAKTPEIIESPEKISDDPEQCFATPKTKAKRKRKKKSNSKTVLMDSNGHDSDNQTTVKKKCIDYTVTKTSLPSVDVYETDSNQSEITNICAFDDKSSNTDKINNPKIDSMFVPLPDLQNNQNLSNISIDLDVIDLTDPTDLVIADEIFLSNVTGMESERVENNSSNNAVETTSAMALGSTKVPRILYENLDFDKFFLEGKHDYNRKMYSISELRQEMDKFYNESWGGENFNHREIQNSMSRDKKLWTIDPKDRMPTPRKKLCTYCNQYRHSDANCPRRPIICHMCGGNGHFDNRCPRKICTNCGSTNSTYSPRCSRCSSWVRLRCAECGQFGHPISHCPDFWRRYHNTIDENVSLEECRQLKKHYQMFCSGCTRRGHLVHNCRMQPFSAFAINSPYVSIYRPIYPGEPSSNRSSMSNDNQMLNNSYPLISKPKEPYKRQHSKSLSFEEPSSKKRNMSESECMEPRGINHIATGTDNTFGKITQDKIIEDCNLNNSIKVQVSKESNYLPIISNNHDNKGHLIQDNEISDTSDVVTSARIYVSNDVIDKLKSAVGDEWLKTTSSKHHVLVQFTDVNSFLNIKGKLDDQEAFHSELRDWAKTIVDDTNTNSEVSNRAVQESWNNSCAKHIPKNRNSVIQKLNKSFEKLDNNFGDPFELFDELTQLQNNHEHLLNQSNVNPCKLSNNRTLINSILKRLNIILIGQAGLGNGTKHLNQLYNLQKKVINLKQKNISINLREEIGQHYYPIFTAVPRDDYVDLLKVYTACKQSRVIFANNEMDTQPLQPNHKARTVALTKLNPFSFINNRIVVRKNQHKINNIDCSSNQTASVRKNQLIFYKKKIMNCHPVDYNHKKVKFDLTRKLNFHIESLTKKENASTKTIKKIKKIQAQAQFFLNKF